MMAAIRITLEKYFLRVVMGFLPRRFGAFFPDEYIVRANRSRRQQLFLKISFYSACYGFLKQKGLTPAVPGDAHLSPSP